MIDRAKAYTIARDYLDREALEGFKQWKLFLLDRGRPDLAETYEFPDLVIDDQATQEKPFGWVFFWNSREYYETEDGGKCILGNGPLVVDRCDGSIHQLPTYAPPEQLIEEYEHNRTQNCE